MSSLFGLETEYGLYVEGKEVTELTEEARQVVRAYPGASVNCWDYRGEDPRRDMRGFQADKLTTNPEDDRLEEPGGRPLSPNEDKCDQILTNGARLYNDHGHPEYATPECSSLLQLVAHDKAGERIVLMCARRRSAQAAGRDISIYKNNTDFHGMSYGCHENYLVSRETPFDRLMGSMLPFLVTRQIFAGAGKVGSENDGWRGGKCQYQLSQRSDFCDVVASVDTLHRRPIINTRDEPHADAARYRRFHVIVGDANMSQYATALKIGTTSLVLKLIETGWDPSLDLDKPVETLKAVSRDRTFRWEVKLADGSATSATEIQFRFLEAARQEFTPHDEETDWLLGEWQRVLEQLSKDPFKLADRLDWVAKRNLLQSYVDAEEVRWDEEILKSLDLEYHNIDPDAGLFYALEDSGSVLRLVEESAIRRAMEDPPDNTRALLRGHCVRQMADSLRSVQWERLCLARNGGTRTFDLSNLVDGQGDALTQELQNLNSLGSPVRN